MSEERPVRQLYCGVTRSQSRFLAQELLRLKMLYGIEITEQDYITLLIDTQRVRVLFQSKNATDATFWLFSKVRSMQDEVVSGRVRTPVDTARDDAVDQAEIEDGGLSSGPGDRPDRSH